MASTEDNRLEYSGVLDRIRSILPSLIPSEQRVATEVVENPENVLDLPAAAMAARTGTSAATVSRASKNLGFSGYQHLRMLIARELGARSSGGSVADEPGDRGIVRSSFSKAADALSIAVDSIDFEAFNRAADLIAGAGRVLIVANGGSAPLAHAVTIQFLASERVAEAPADAIMQRLSAVGLRSGDVCLAVSESGSNALTIAAAREAKVAGASVIGLTAFARTALAELADVALIAGATYRWDLDRVGGNIVQTVLLSSLHSAVIGRVQKAPKVSDRYIETVAQLTIEEPGEPPAP